MTDRIDRYFDEVRRAGRHRDAQDVAVSPDGRHVAFTRHVGRGSLLADARRVAVWSLDSGRVSLAGNDQAHDTHQPCWGPSGRLAWIASREGESWIELAEPAPEARPSTRVLHEPVGTVEYLEWSPSGTQLLAGIAEPGASQSDTFGSGHLPVAGTAPSWTPWVASVAERSGLRNAWVVDAATGDARQVTRDLVVWQATWAGPDRLLCVVSEDPGEDGWYGARLVTVELDAASRRDELVPVHQLGVPAASASGERLSVISGWMSDRGIYSGDLLLRLAPGAAWAPLDTDGVDVSDQRWLDEHRLVYAGMCGLDTVIAEHDVHTGTTTTLWRSEQTCGVLLPQFGAAAGASAGATADVTVAVSVHSADRPPAVAVLDGDGLVPCPHVPAPEHGPGHARGHGSAPEGSPERIRWTAPGGYEVEALLVVPSAAPEPYPLIVSVHGGPVWAWRNSWQIDESLTPLLADAGYAVLHPNLSGSVGRGQAFIDAGVRDMGGRDVAELLSGVDALLASGRVDPDRIAVMGESYGGYLAAWLVTQTDRFAAAVARSPVTEWVSEHYASDIGVLDRLYFEAHPLDLDSIYHSRNPLRESRRAKTPMLLVTGARDLATPPDQARMFYRALRENGTQAELLVYPEEGHGVIAPVAQIDHARRVLEFLDRHLRPGGTTRETG